MRKHVFLLKHSHSHTSQSRFLSCETPHPNAQATGWEDACCWEEVVGCEPGGQKGCVTSFPGDFWFQEGLKCVRFPRTLSGRDSAQSGPAGGGGPGAARPGMLPPPSAQHPGFGQGYYVATLQPCSLLLGSVCGSPPPGPQHLATVPPTPMLHLPAGCQQTQTSSARATHRAQTVAPARMALPAGALCLLQPGEQRPRRAAGAIQTAWFLTRFP